MDGIIAIDQTPVAITEPGPYQVRLAGRIIDVRGAVPLTPSDMRVLEKNQDAELRVTFKQLAVRDFTWDQLGEIAFAVVRKVDSSISRADVMNAPLPVLNNLVGWAMEDGRASRPT